MAGVRPRRCNCGWGAHCTRVAPWERGGSELEGVWTTPVASVCKKISNKWMGTQLQRARIPSSTLFHLLKGHSRVKEVNSLQFERPTPVKKHDSVNYLAWVLESSPFPCLYNVVDCLVKSSFGVSKTWVNALSLDLENFSKGRHPITEPRALND